eukprot:gene13086-15088_t
MSSESVSTLETSSVTNLKGKVPKCLIACSGSVATLKIPELVAELSLHFEVMIICTTSAAFFLEKAQVYNEVAWKKFEIAGGWNLVLKDEDEWQMWNTIGNSVLHIEMRRWADVLIVAPASANVIAKSSYGIADNFVLSVMRAWDFRKPCILCPAMNTVMWTHPSTQESLSRLQAWGWEVLGPVEKTLACNEKGNGAMVSVQDIKTFLVNKFSGQSPGTPHKLTGSNLQLHSMLLNTSSSTCPPAVASKENHHSNSNQEQVNKLKSKVPSKGTPPAKDHPESAPVEHQTNQLATSETKPVIASMATTTPVDKKPTVGRVKQPSFLAGVVNNFLLGVGVGVGMMGVTAVLGVVLSFFRATAPGAGGLRIGAGDRNSSGIAV